MRKLVGIIFYPPKPHRSREGLRLNFGHLVHVIPKKDAYDVLMYSPLEDSPFFCFELYYIWEIAFSPTKDEYNEYNCISANIVHEVLKHVSDISWGYVIHV